MATKRHDTRARMSIIGAALALGGAAAMVAVWPAPSPLLTPQDAETAQIDSAVRSAVSVDVRNDSELAFATSVALDVWTEYPRANQPITIVVDGAGRAALAERGIATAVEIEDIDAVALAERARLANRARVADGNSWFTEYRDIQEIAEFVDRFDPRVLGRSIEGRPIHTFDIGSGPTRIVINGGQHAREWIAVMVPLCIAERLRERRHVDPRIERILQEVTFSFAPLINPDGYVFSWNVDRYWRKNRRDGHGVDLNRNYSVAWGKKGSSGNKRSQTYRGRHAFSEPESRAMAELFEAGDVSAHLDFHSYSQLILYPWNYSREHPKHRAKFAAAADKMSSAMVAAHGKRYQIKAGAELMGGASGTLTDYTYGERGALSFVVELRPKRGPNGFVLPPEQIVPTCDEGMAATLELAEFVIADTDR